MKMVKLVSSCHTLEHLNCNLNKAKKSEGESEASQSFKMDSPHFNSQAYSQSRFISQSSGQVPRLQFSSHSKSPPRRNEKQQQLIYYNFSTFKKFWELREKTKLVQRSPNFYAFCSHLSEGNWMPRNREGATFNQLDQYSALLFGDTRLGNALSSETEAFKLDFYNDGKWIKLSIANPQMLYSRMNHATCDSWDDKGIFIFGGEILFRPMPGQTSIKQQVQNRKECSNDLLFLDFSKDSDFLRLADTSIKSIHYKSKIVEPRRAHILQRFGKTLILYGGVNHYGQIKSDVWYYDIDSNKFQEQEIFVNHLGSIAFASSCAVFYPRVQNQCELSVKNAGQINWKIVENFIRQQGIYIFGGKRNKEELNDAVYVIEITNKNEEGPLSEPQITEVCTYGIGPCPRYQHSMQYYAKRNQIVVVGGRNDYEYQERGEVIFNDIYLLSLGKIEVRNLDSYTWSQLILKYGPSNYPRSNHASILLNDRLIIYGGVDRNFKLIGEIDIIELDQEKVNHYYEIEERKIRKQSTRHSTLDQSSYLNPSGGMKQVSSSRLLTPQNQLHEQGNQRYQQRTPDQLWLNTINQVDDCDQTFARLKNYEREDGQRSRSPTHPTIGISLIPEMLGFEERYTQRFLNEKKHMFQKRKKETMTPKCNRAPKQPLMMFYSKPEKYVIDETNYMTPYMADLEAMGLNDELDERI